MMLTYQIPTPASQALTVSKYELLMYLRSKKILGMVAITVAVSSLFIGFFEYTETQGPQMLEFNLETPIGFAFFLIVITVAFFGSGSISSEFNQKTGQVLFSNPISKTSIWFGKFIAAQIITFSVITLYYAIITSYAVISYDVPTTFLTSLLFSFVSSTMIMSIAFLISSIFHGHAGSTILIFTLFIIVFPIVDFFMPVMSGDTPWFTPTFSSGIIKHIITVPYPDVENAMNIPFFAPSVPKIVDSLGVMVSYIIACSALSIFIFKRKELT